MFKIKETIIRLLLRKEVYVMAMLYATLIIKGKKRFSDVPETLKDEVRQILIDADVEYLAQ